MIKRLFDVFVSTIGLFLIAVPFLFLLAWVRFDSPGPAIYTQKRVGKNGVIFTIYKIRTMVVDADMIGGYSTKEFDPRITKSGAFLRRNSLDELPQLWNVCKGEMSLVGPRPDVPHQERSYSPDDWSKRITVKPGVTGLAQARLRSSATYEERLALDLAYIDNPTFEHDLLIMLETARTLLSRKAI